jgi:hypothetical protein
MADLIQTDYQTLLFKRYYSLFKMPSSLNLFIRVPKGFSEQDVFDSVIRMDICKVIDVVIKKGKTTNNAIVMIDYWYKGTKPIRDALIRGEPISIPNPGPHTWLAFEFKPKIKSKTNTESAKVHPAPLVDEFGRDITRKPKPTLSSKAPVFLPIAPALPIAPTLSEMLPPFVTDNRRERARNQYAAESFIEQYECYATPEKTYRDDAIAPGAPMKPMHADEVEEGELCEVVQRLDQMFIEQPIAAAADTISDITDYDYDEPVQEKKEIYIPVDFDKPKNHVINVDYSNVIAVKKRNIRFIKPTQK